MLTEKAKELLRQLDDELSNFGSDDLWSILTALRGPDSNEAVIGDPGFDHYGVKMCTTAVIRRRVFPKTSSLPIHVIGVVREDTDYAADQRKKMYRGHFMNHAKAAFDALGLKWGTWNKD